jgi:hypothetical protein
MMKITSVVLIIALTGTAFGYDISSDGRDTSVANLTPGHIVTILNVPLPIAPDYSCDIRMQVGSLDFGDFNNDGDPDLAVGCYHSQSYPPYNDWRNFVLVNNDGQLESTPTWYSTDSRSTCSIKWADFNGDGYLDLFAANGDFSLDPNVIYFGSADGLANTPGWVVNDNTWTLSAAPFDFDQDGDIDLATASEGVYPNYNRPIYIYYNNGNGLDSSPSWQSSDSSISEAVSWADIDGDGWYDLAVAKWVNFQTCIYPNNEGSMQTTPNWAISASFSDGAIGSAEVDDDSFPELAVGGTDPTRLYDNVDGVLETTPIWQSNSSYFGTQDLAWGDIDGDGDPDLATVEFSTGELRVYLNVDGVLESTPSWVYRAGSVGTALAFGDVNGDGQLDLAMGVSGQPCVLVFLNTGSIAVDDKPFKPGSFELSQNYPNPFNAATFIQYELGRPSDVRIEIFDLLGNKVKILVSEHQEAGAHSVVWNGKDAPSGVYFYKIKAGDFTDTRRMLLLK